MTLTAMMTKFYFRGLVCIAQGHMALGEGQRDRGILYLVGNPGAKVKRFRWDLAHVVYDFSLVYRSYWDIKQINLS
jgi:hypothetical protein